MHAGCESGDEITPDTRLSPYQAMLKSHGLIPA